MPSRRSLIWVAAAALPLGVLAVGVALRHPGVSIPTAITSCLPCHISAKLELNGRLAARFSEGVHPVNAAKIRPSAISLASKDCAACHLDSHRTQIASVHQSSFTNKIFNHAFMRDKEAWCLNCHAPLWSGDDKDLPKAVELARTLKNLPLAFNEGVNCAVCHVRNGEIYGTGKGSHATGAKHFVRVTQELRSEKLCAGCHQFKFPTEIKPVVIYHQSAAMQNVVEEHLALRDEKSKRCADCHFKSGDHSLHQIDTTDMRTKFSVAVSMSSSATEFVGQYKLRTPAIGHHFPTGDLFRQVRLEFFARDNAKIGEASFRKEVRVVDQVLTSDTTLKPVRIGDHAVASGEIHLKTKPERCTLTYRLQGNIESTLEKEGELRDFVRELAPCKLMWLRQLQ